MKVIAVLNYVPQFQFPSHARLHKNLKFHLEYHVLIVCEKAPHITSYSVNSDAPDEVRNNAVFHQDLYIQNG